MTLKGNVCQILTVRSVPQVLASLLCVFCCANVVAQEQIAEQTVEPKISEPKPESVTPLSQDVEDLKQAALELNRDLLILEEELLFPANTQITVFLSLDVGEYFQLDAVKLSIDDKQLASHLYTPGQNSALSRGGIQRLYIGNLKNGEHEITAVFTGYGPDAREYKRATTTKVEKQDDAILLELRITDSTQKMQPEFDIKEWQL